MRQKSVEQLNAKPERRGKIDSVPKVWLSSAEAQAYLGMGADFLDALRENALIHYYKVRGSIFYRIEDIDALVLNNRVI